MFFLARTRGYNNFIFFIVFSFDWSSLSVFSEHNFFIIFYCLSSLSLFRNTTSLSFSIACLLYRFLLGDRYLALIKPTVLKVPKKNKQQKTKKKKKHKKNKETRKNTSGFFLLFSLYTRSGDHVTPPSVGGAY